LHSDAAAMRAFSDEPLAQLRAAFTPETGDAPRVKCDPARLVVRAPDAFDLFQIEYGAGSAWRRFALVPSPAGPRWRVLDARESFAW
jgi:hypothetical protein